ncbi:MAG: trypsin-like peptidase domain-containing protein [Planctomycetaceae bacterium]|nr:trypsin-like peptidase domain-containing protein [Planctomycetaceae bacterium]
MASFDLQDFGLDEPPRPTTPPVRRGFLVALFVLGLLASLMYGIPYVAEHAGYAWEAGRARAASQALAELDKAGAVNRASALFRMATAAVAPAVVRVETRRLHRGGFALEGPLHARGFEGFGLGSGVIFDKDRGFIVTNHHVVKEADQIVVRLSRGNDVPARLVGADTKTDLAVLQVSAWVHAAAEWGDSDKLDIGDWVLAIGSPFALDHTVTAGIVSATERNDLRINEYESFIQTDAAINPGNSGGPLVDLTGKVVGINTAIYTLNQGNEGIGLAIPATMARRVVESLIKDGRVIRGYLGVSIQPLNPVLAKNFGLPDPRGALVMEVRPDSPAARAGLMVGDVIVGLAGKEVADPAGLKNQTAGLAIGSKVPVDVYREGKRQTLTVTIAELNALPTVATIGFDVREIPSEDEDGSTVLVIDQVVAGSPAARAGLRPGLRVLAVGSSPVRNKADFESAIASFDLAQGIPMKVMSPDGQTTFIRVGGPAVGRH